MRAPDQRLTGETRKGRAEEPTRTPDRRPTDETRRARLTWNAILFVFVCNWTVGWCGAGNVLEIIEMHVPLVVENGSNSSVVLDCDYALRQPDKSSELVVQWYVVLFFRHRKITR